MSSRRSRAAAGSVVAWVALLTGCGQLDQLLPLDVNPGQPVSKSIGPEGGVISVLPGFSIRFPPGALPQSVFIPVTPRSETSPFPGTEGRLVPGTAYDIGPAGVPLTAPAQLFVRLPPSLLDLGAGEDLRLVLARVLTDGSVSVGPGAYDATNGFFSAVLGEIGPIAVVVTPPVVPASGRASTPVDALGR